jgi:threonylcarbamoyladenosine tRNA methylthiotransferase MtaB
VAFHTFGCKVNQFDTEGLISKFKAEGYEIVPFSAEADVYVINTCTVTKTAEQKARQVTRRIKRAHTGALVVVTGCYAQTNPEDIAALPEVDLIVGVSGRSTLVDLVNERLRAGNEKEAEGCGFTRVLPESRRTRVHSWTAQPGFEVYTPEFAEKTRAFLKIEDGCESYCSYCKIPFARGPVRSLPPDQVRAEIRRLKEAGFKELVLVGIHLGNYGKDLGKNLAELLGEVAEEHKETSAFRFRLSSIEPTDFTPELIRVVLGSDLFCPHFHIPLQSGSDTVLQRMNRPYSTRDYRELLQKLREYRPGLAVSTDLMVGFPGETEEEFAETLRFLREEKFSRVHIFPYSAREGTKAVRLPNQLRQKEKEERVKRAELIVEEVVGGYRQTFFGETVEVLTEEEVAPGVWEGFSGEYLRVRLREGDALLGGDGVGALQGNTLVRARVINTDDEPLLAEVEPGD